MSNTTTKFNRPEGFGFVKSLHGKGSLMTVSVQYCLPIDNSLYHGITMDEITAIVHSPAATRDRLPAKRKTSPALLNNQFGAEKKKGRKENDDRPILKNWLMNYFML
eukprot:10747231-Ditylum_brightwellii.AAC.1